MKKLILIFILLCGICFAGQTNFFKVERVIGVAKFSSIPKTNVWLPVLSGMTLRSNDFIKTHSNTMIMIKTSRKGTIFIPEKKRMQLIWTIDPKEVEMTLNKIYGRLTEK